MLAHLFAFFLGLVIQPMDTPGGPIPHFVGTNVPSVSVAYDLARPTMPELPIA
jgi:hypothetical protein